MSSSYTPPSVSKRTSAVEKQIEEETVTVEETKPVTTEDIYKEAIDKFVLFVKGDLYSGQVEQRTAFQLSFIDSVNNMLKLDEMKLKTVLDYFVKTIATNRTILNDSDIISPLYSVESLKPAQDILRYKRFMVFLITYSDNVKDKQRFLANFDVAKFANMFGEVIKQNLINYVYR